MLGSCEQVEPDNKLAALLPQRILPQYTSHN